MGGPGNVLPYMYLRNFSNFFEFFNFYKGLCFVCFVGTYSGLLGHLMLNTPKASIELRFHP